MQPAIIKPLPGTTLDPMYPDADGRPMGDTDFHAVAEGYVSVTPLTIDLTNHAALDGLRNWFGT